MLTIRCQCGEVFHAEERHIGRAIKCRCGQILNIGVTASTSIGPASGRWSIHRWGIAALALVVVMTMAAVLLFTRESELQQPVTQQQPISRPPAKVVSKPAPEPLKLSPAPHPAPGPRIVLEPAPAAPKTKPVVSRLKTGTNILTPRGPSGRGTLRIDNGTSYDSTVRLLDEETHTVRQYVYIRAREATTLSAIGPCQCGLYFALGTDWSRPEKKFLENSSYSVFDEPLWFNESRTDNRVRWATFSVTLHPVPEGTAKTTQLSKEEFERRLGRGANL